MTDTQYRCATEALDGAERLRYQGLRTVMKAAFSATRELPDGYAMRFPPDPGLFLQVAEWVTLERRCCPFLAFGLDWSGSEAPQLRLTGGPGVKAFLGSQLAGKPDRSRVPTAER